MGEQAMNALLLGLLLLCPFTFAGKAAPGAGKDVVLFLEGLAVGVEEDFGNVTECTADLELTLQDFEKGYALIGQGMRHYSISDIRKGLDAFSAGLQEIKKAIDDCGTEEFAQAVEAIIQDFSSWVGVARFCYHELITIFHERSTLQKDFPAAEAAFKAKEYLFDPWHFNKTTVGSERSSFCCYDSKK